MVNERKCKECGNDFDKGRTDKIYCSEKCMDKSWKRNNKDKKLKIRRTYYYKNREKALEAVKKWKNIHKDYHKNYDKVYLSDEENKIKAIIRIATLKKYGKAEVCSICNSKIKAEHHHFRPYKVDNFVDLCKECHFKLYHRIFEQ